MNNHLQCQSTANLKCFHSGSFTLLSRTNVPSSNLRSMYTSFPLYVFIHSPKKHQQVQQNPQNLHKFPNPPQQVQRTSTSLYQPCSIPNGHPKLIYNNSETNGETSLSCWYHQRTKTVMDSEECSNTSVIVLV